jgi:UDP-N-acetylmuramate dehydrogenase
VINLPEFLESINSRFPAFQGTFRFNEPMADHTTFKVGGPADLWIRPEGDFFPRYAAALLESARQALVPVFILGGGANLVVSDRGIRGIVLDTGGYCGVREEILNAGDTGEGHEGIRSLSFYSGTSVEEAVETAASRGLSGLEFLAGMPGSIGGALWMNARCYEREMSDVVAEVEILKQGKIVRLPQHKEDYGYKESPFQNRACLILTVLVLFTQRQPACIREAMEVHRKDREEKGHYRFPSAGSAFKNNRDFGKPTGKLIDELGLRGLTVGDAQVAPWHGNFIINRGRARAADIKNLVDELVLRVQGELGIKLEPEILFAGDWA